MKASCRFVAGALLCVLPAVTGALCDTVTLWSGELITAEVSLYTPDGVILLDSEGVLRRVKPKEIDAIEFAPKRWAGVWLESGGVCTRVVPLKLKGRLLQCRTARGNEFFPLTQVKSLAVGERLFPVRTISKEGAEATLSTLAVPGELTVFCFCIKARQVTLKSQLKELAKREQDVFVRFIDIHEWGSPIAMQHGVTTLPHVCVLGPDTKQVGDVCTTYVRVKRYVREARAVARADAIIVDSLMD